MAPNPPEADTMEFVWFLCHAQAHSSLHRLLMLNIHHLSTEAYMNTACVCVYVCGRVCVFVFMYMYNHETTFIADSCIHAQNIVKSMLLASILVYVDWCFNCDDTTPSKCIRYIGVCKSSNQLAVTYRSRAFVADKSNNIH